MSHAQVVSGVVLAVAAAGLLVAWAVRGSPGAEAVEGRAGEAPRPVEVVAPRRETIHRRVTVPAEVCGWQDVSIYTKVAGTVEEIRVDRGDRVLAGDVLAVVLAPEVVAGRERAAAAVRRAEATADLAGTLAARAEALHARSPDLISGDQLDEARARLAVAKADLDLAGRELDAATALVDWLTITAPFDGVVADRWADRGTFVSAPVSGQKGAVAVVRVVQTDPVRVRFRLPDREAAHLAAGARVRVEGDGLSGGVEAAVARTAFALDEATRTLLVEADAPNPEGRIRPGQYARVEVDLDAHVGVLTLPSAAVLAARRSRHVFVVADGRVVRRPVTVGIDDGVRVEVTGGLTGEEDVISAGQGLVDEGDAVAVSWRTEAVR